MKRGGFQFFLISNPSNRKIEGGYSQIRSSAWLEHYTDNVGVSSSNLLGSTKLQATCMRKFKPPGGLAQLARASALQAEGHRFDSDILHTLQLPEGSLGVLKVEF
jgi:hypothetical protein